MTHEQISPPNGAGEKVHNHLMPRENSPTTESNSSVKEVRIGVPDEYLNMILTWAADRETSLHLDPKPIDPKDVLDPKKVKTARQELRDYYGNPNLIPFLALDAENIPIGVVSMRVRGDKYISKQEEDRAPVLERLIVDPNKRRKGVGRDLCATAINYMLGDYEGYQDEEKRNRHAGSIWAWVVMTKDSDWGGNFTFFRELGFRNRGQIGRAHV